MGLGDHVLQYATIVTRHCSCRTEVQQDCIFWQIPGGRTKGCIILYSPTMSEPPSPDRPALINSAWSYRHRPDFLMHARCTVTFACWSNQLFGGYNLMRCLHLDDHDKNKLLLIYPSQWLGRWAFLYYIQIASEVATMEYTEAYTNFSVRVHGM